MFNGPEQTLFYEVERLPASLLSVPADSGLGLSRGSSDNDTSSGVRGDPGFDVADRAHKRLS